MERNNPFIAAQAKRHEVRVRALLYTEYILFSKILQSGGNLGRINPDSWRYEVSRVEYHILLDEAPELLTIRLENWEPLGVFFDLVISDDQQ